MAMPDHDVLPTTLKGLGGSSVTDVMRWANLNPLDQDKGKKTGMQCAHNGCTHGRCPVQMSLTPKGVKNLICAGRITGGDRVSHAATRNMMCCTVTGQGAGVAAAIAAQQKRGFDELDIGQVQAELKRQDVRLH